MTEQAPLTLDDVRQRFLEAQAQLTDASGAIESIRQSADQLGAAREGLADAGKEVATLAERFGSVADALTKNAHQLTAGVEAIRLGDPAAIRQEIQELDAAFTAFQSVMVDRLKVLEATLAGADSAAKAQQREHRLTTALLLVAIVVVAVLLIVL